MQDELEAEDAVIAVKDYRCMQHDGRADITESRRINNSEAGTGGRRQ